MRREVASVISVPSRKPAPEKTTAMFFLPSPSYNVDVGEW